MSVFCAATRVARSAAVPRATCVPVHVLLRVDPGPRAPPCARPAVRCSRRGSERSARERSARPRNGGRCAARAGRTSREAAREPRTLAHRYGIPSRSISDSRSPPGCSTQIEGAKRRRSSRSTMFSIAPPDPAVVKFGIVNRIGVGAVHAAAATARPWPARPPAEATAASRSPTCGRRRPTMPVPVLPERRRGRTRPPGRDPRRRASPRRAAATDRGARTPSGTAKPRLGFGIVSGRHGPGEQLPQRRLARPVHACRRTDRCAGTASMTSRSSSGTRTSRLWCIEAMSTFFRPRWSWP